MMQMLRPKRQAHAAATAAADDAGHSAMTAATATADMDPSAMTERQQLAFLLRATAPASDASASASSSSDNEADGDDVQVGRRRIPRGSRSERVGSRSSPRNTAAATASVAGHCGRGRPPKNAIKLAPGQTGDEHKKLLSPRSAASAKKQPTRKRLKVNTVARRRGGDHHDDHAGGHDDSHAARGREDAVTEDAKLDKTSPSSSSDVLRLSAFGDSGGDFWRAHCALCCDNAKLAAAFGVDALFLCPSCDQKYPTQRALGLV